MMAAAIHVASVWIDLLVRDSLLVVVIFPVVAVIARCGRMVGPAFHVALWSLVFVRLILPPGLSHPLSFGRVLSGVSPSGIAGPVGHFEAVGGDFFGDPAGPPAAGENRHELPRTGTPIVAIAWLAGAVTVFLVYRRRMAVFNRILREAHVVTTPEVDALVDTWRERLGVRRRVNVLASAERVSPFTTGVFRPVILVPASVLLDARCLEPVIAHEMAHVARLDALWLQLQHLMQSVYFFHPLVWISGVKLNQERERLADATAVSAGALSAGDYVGGLLNVLRLDLQGVGAPTMSARKRRIGVRIQHILDREGGRRPRVATAVTGIFLLGVFLLPLGPGGEAMEADVVERQATSSPAAAADRSAFVNPLPSGRITWTWGPGKKDPFNNSEEVFHRGIDVAVQAGTPVVSPAAGVVTVATESYEVSAAYGTVIVIDHGNGLATLYSHLGSLEVSEGQRVSQNEVIATVGSTGKSTGPHLHFEVRQDGESLDPADFVADWK